MNGAYLLSSLGLLEETIVLGLSGTALFPSKDSLAFDVIGFQVLNIVGLTNGLDQSAHLVGELGNKDHCLEMRRDGAFRCCHPCESDEDGIDRKGRVGVPGDDDVHRRFELLISGGDPGLAVGGLKVLRCYGSEHRVDVGVLLDGFLEEIQNSGGERWVKVKHDVP